MLKIQKHKKKKKWHVSIYRYLTIMFAQYKLHTNINEKIIHSLRSKIYSFLLHFPLAALSLFLTQN